MNQFIKSKLKEFDKKFPYADFCWKEEMPFGKEIAEKEQKKAKKFLSRSLESAFQAGQKNPEITTSAVYGFEAGFKAGQEEIINKILKGVDDKDIIERIKQFLTNKNK